MSLCCDDEDDELSVINTLESIFVQRLRPPQPTVCVCVSVCCLNLSSGHMIALVL